MANKKTATADGSKISALRIARGLTVEDLARKAGYSKKTVENAIAGKHTQLSTLENLADALGVSYSDLLDEKDSINSVMKGGFRIQIVMQGNLDEFNNNPLMGQFLALLKMMLPNAGDLQIIDVKEGSVIITLDMSKKDALALVALFPDFRELAREAIRETPEGKAYFRGEEGGELARMLLMMVDGVRELRILTTPDADDEVKPPEPVVETPKAMEPDSVGEPLPRYFVDGLESIMVHLKMAKEMPVGKERDNLMSYIMAELESCTLHGETWTSMDAAQIDAWLIGFRELVEKNKRLKKS